VAVIQTIHIMLHYVQVYHTG